MEISITAVTKNRKFSKSLVRFSSALATLKEMVNDLDMSNQTFDVLQIVFVDKEEGHLRVIGCKNDRLFQIEVSIPSENICDLNNEKAFIRFIGQKINASIDLIELPIEFKILLKERINAITMT